MAHYGLKSKNLLLKIRTGYAEYLDRLATAGTREDIIEYVNSISVKMDVETLLKRELTTLESNRLLMTPEENTGLNKQFGMAHMVARNLQNQRAMLRTMLRQHRLAEIPGKLKDMSKELQAIAR